jgi:hypothetical protein
MKIVAKNQKRLMDQVGANDAFQKSIETLNEPFEKILCSSRNLLHLPRSKLGKDDQAQRNHPTDDHGIGDREAKQMPDLDSFLRQAVFLLSRGRLGLALSGSLGRHG